MVSLRISESVRRDVRLFSEWMKCAVISLVKGRLRAGLSWFALSVIAPRMRGRFPLLLRWTSSLLENVTEVYSNRTSPYSVLRKEEVSLNEAYFRTKQKCESKKLPYDVNPKGVFACNELDLKEVKVYGFDYDYTLAVYKPSMDLLLYNLGRESLIKKFKYPSGISDMPYLPHFAIRGLHYDIEKGLLMKLDSFLQIQLGTVYRGLSPVPDEEVLRLYKNKTVPIAYVESPGPQKLLSSGTRAVPRTGKVFFRNLLQGMEPPHNRQMELFWTILDLCNNKETLYLTSKMVQLADLFSVPEMCLLCNVAEYFERNNIDYNPQILFQDVKTSVGTSHPVMHKMLLENMSEYLNTNPGLREWFTKLVNAGKKLFLVTNSPYQFVNRGMQLMVGRDWEDFFDVIIVQARKPSFFTDESRPVRIYDRQLDTHLWDKVTALQKGYIYYEGTVNQLQDLTGWRGGEVLYFGDHPYSDLADVTLEHGWRTGAIIQELTHEIATLNEEAFKKNCNWLQMLTQLIEECQDVNELGAKEILASWATERDRIRQEIKTVFNPQFGSVFRTYHNPTYFSRRLFRFADIYTSKVTNLLDFSVDHVFYPRRGVMPHEYTSYFV